MELSSEWIGQYLEYGDLDTLTARLTAAGHAVEGRRTVDDLPDDAQNRGADVVLDIDITTNRPDCMCHLGMAREAAALLGVPLQDPAVHLLEDAEPTEHAASLAIDEPVDCPSFVALVIRGVKVGPSPDWLVRRLQSIGLRSINNIVDVTNFVLWETGQPMHAYDLDTLAAGADGKPEIRVRKARSGETLTTLDGVERTLTDDMLVIADAEKAIGLAGVMGGLETEVTETTADVLLEIAHFRPGAVRKAAKALGMKTDASHRYERGADPLACLQAGRRAMALFAEVAGGQVLAGHLQVSDLRDDWPPRVDLDLARLRVFGGAPLEASEVETILGSLGFALERTDDQAAVHSEAADGTTGRWRVTVPSWRWYDFEKAHAQDVYEEILRVYGFDRVPPTLPAISGIDAVPSASHQRRRRSQDLLAASGYAEAITFAFLDRPTDASFPSLLLESGSPDAVPLANPLSESYAVMRRSILANLTAVALWNQRRGASAVRLFEVGHVFGRERSDGDEGRADDRKADEAQTEGESFRPVDPRLIEREAVAVICGGRLGTPWSGEADLDFFDLKGVVEALCASLGVDVSCRAAAVTGMVAGTGAELVARLAGEDDAGDEADRVVGVLGQLDLDGATAPLFGAEILLDALETPDEPDLRVDPPSRFPGVSVDTTLTHPVAVTWGEIAAEIDSARADGAAEHLDEVTMIDRYTGAGVPDGAVNTTLTMSFVAPDRSLTQDEVNERHQRLTERLESRYGVDAEPAGADR